MVEVEIPADHYLQVAQLVQEVQEWDEGRGVARVVNVNDEDVCSGVVVYLGGLNGRVREKVGAGLKGPVRKISL